VIPTPNVRALFEAATVQQATAPYDTVHLKVFYPAAAEQGADTLELGVVPADPGGAPYPVVLLFNGIDCGPDRYQWLAQTLAGRGSVAITFSWVAEMLPGFVALTPGIDMALGRAGSIPERPSAAALPALFDALERLQARGPLAGLLDLDHIVLGGHSAGGRVAVDSADPRFDPRISGAFAYGAHTGGFVMLGHPPETILPLPDRLPLLLMVGTSDGVIPGSARRYGAQWQDAVAPVERTFRDALAGGRGDSWLLVIDGANHFSIADPPDDPATGRAFLDRPAEHPAPEIRALIGEAVGRFVDVAVGRARAGDGLAGLGTHPLVSALECR